MILGNWDTNRGYAKSEDVNATVNTVPVISWRSILLVKDFGVLGENHRPAANL